jgi:hypothetical protein
MDGWMDGWLAVGVCEEQKTSWWRHESTVRRIERELDGVESHGDQVMPPGRGHRCWNPFVTEPSPILIVSK